MGVIPTVLLLNREGFGSTHFNGIYSMGGRGGGLFETSTQRQVAAQKKAPVEVTGAKFRKAGSDYVVGVPNTSTSQ
jgi:hypothetical protein